MLKTNLYLVLLIISAMACGRVSAQTPADSVVVPSAAPEWQIDSTKTEQLLLNLKSTLFFRDNEISTPLMRGYTLPGFRLSPTVSYSPSPYVNVELGLYLFRFWGTDHYPNMAYGDITNWTGKENTTRGFHLLPLFRVQMASKHGLNIVLGSIYGGRYHQLIEPLYAPELNLIADPESGAQILYTNKWVDFDTWVNWESFIYRNDTHQEAFTFGVSTKFKINRTEARAHVFAPVQLLFQHRGGEIDTLYTNSVQTLFNGAAGIGTTLNINHKCIKSLTLQADALVYNQQVGDIWPYDHGWGYFAHAHLDMGHLKAKVGYMESHKFVSLFGYPFFGSISTSNEGLTFDTSSNLLAGVDYNYEVSPGYVLGANAVVFHHMPGMGMRDGATVHYGPSTSFCGSIYFRLNPSFILKSWR